MCVFSCNCEATITSPFRTVVMDTPEDVKCVGKDAFYGENGMVLKFVLSAVRVKMINFFYTTQFSGHKCYLNAYERTPSNVKQTYHTFVRKVIYDVTKLPIYGKWKAGVQ